MNAVTRRDNDAVYVSLRKWKIYINVENYISEAKIYEGVMRLAARHMGVK